MAKFDRSSVSFNLKETGKGYFQFVLADGGKYSLDDIDSVLTVLGKYPEESLNQYQLWLDWAEAPVNKAPVKFGAVLKFTKAKNTETTLVLTKRPFPQVKIKVSRDGGVSSRKTSNLREL
jgi:hypothetical protein